MLSSYNYEPLEVIDYSEAPSIQGYQNGTLILGSTHVLGATNSHHKMLTRDCFAVTTRAALQLAHAASFWVAIEEFNLSYHNEYIYIYSKVKGFPNIVT